MSGKTFDKFAYVKALRGAPMTLAQRCVLMQVWDYSNADGTNAYAGIQRIADDIGANERTVRRSLQWLCEAGWLRKESTGGRSGDGAHWASVYSLAIPPQPDIDDTQPDIESSQPDIEYVSTGHSRPSTGPQTPPPEPVSPEPVSPEPLSTESETPNPDENTMPGRFSHHDKSNGYTAGCGQCEWIGRACVDHYQSSNVGELAGAFLQAAQ